MVIYNSHIHTFTKKDVPNWFNPIMPILKTKAGLWAFENGLKNINPFTDKDTYHKMAKFLTEGNKENQEVILNDCSQWYPEGSKFFICTMDMSNMGAGRVVRPYVQQVEELIELKKRRDDFYIFVHVDFRTPGIVDKFCEWAEKGLIDGMKLYLSLGVFPYDKEFDLAWEACEKYNLPVISHGSPRNPVHNKGSKKEIRKLLEKGKGDINFEGDKKDLCAQFAHPNNYNYVREKYKNVRIDIAHMGSMNEMDKLLYGTKEEIKNSWTTLIVNRCKKNENDYTDISYALADKEYMDLFLILMEDDGKSPVKLSNQTLFGTDFYMNVVEGDERRWSIGVRREVGQELFNKISYINPRKFLNKINK